jgi:hypothetical protein
LSNALASSPLTVTATPIGSPFLIPQSLCVSFASLEDGVLPEIC